jgi:hypothetical protein
MSILAVSALGCRVDLSVEGGRADQAVRAIEDTWSWCLDESPASAEPADHHLRVVLDDDADVVDTAAARGDLAATSLAELLHRLSQEITVACIDHQVGRLLMLHACAVADPSTGRAIAAAAPSGTGKTTFVRTIGRGRVYLSDETVGIREDGVIVPHLKPLSVRPPGGIGFKDQVDPSSFDLLPPDQAATLTQLWFLRRADEPVEPRVEPLGTLDALTTIAPQISYLSATPRPLQRLASTFGAVGGLKLVTYHEAVDLEPLVAAGLGSGR